MKSMTKSSAIVPTILFIALLPFGMASTGRADESALSDEEADAIAIKAVDGIFIDWRVDPIFTRTNGMTVVTLPRYYFPDDNPTNPPSHAAVVWIDDSTGSVIPNPGLIPLTDEQAIFIATNGIRIPFDQRKPISVDRRASLTVVTLPRPDMTLAGFTYTNGCAAKVWIDTETKAVLGVGREAD